MFKNWIGFPDWLSIALGFIIAVSTNFLLSYYWVFRGTSQTRLRGYLFFLTIATIGLLVIVSSTLYLQILLGSSVYFARTLVAIVVGSANFLINTFFNFKMAY